MGFPKKISQLPLNLSLKPEDLLVTVNDSDVTSKIKLEQLISFVTGGTNTFVTGGTYNDVTQNIDFSGTLGFPPFSVSLAGISTSDTFVTGATLNGFTLEIDRNNGEPQITVDLSPLTGDTDTNTFVTGTTLVGNNYTINQNNGSSFTTDFNPIVSGKVDTTLFDSYTGDTQTEINTKLDITTFDTYTANTVDNNTFITGTTLVGTQYTINQNNGSTFATDFESIISGKVDTTLFDIYSGNTQTEINNKLDTTTFDSYTANTTDNVVTGATLVGSTLELERNNGLSDVTVDLGSLSGLTTTVWEEGSAGNFSVKQITDTSTDATGDYAVAQNESTIATGRSSHAEGRFTSALGDYSHAEGFSTEANGNNSHAEGTATRANGLHSHSQNFNTFANGDSSHAEGSSTIADGEASHAQNENTTAAGINSHAGGFNSVATGQQSFIHSTDSLVSGDRSVVIGGQNITGTTADTVYVPFLNINNVGVGASINNLGIDSNGFVVVGATDENVFVNSGNANAATQQLTFTNTTGGTFNVTNAAALFSDNDVNVTGGTYNPTTGCITFSTNSGDTFDICGFVTGFTDVYVTGSTLVGTNYTLTRTDNTTISTDFNPIVSGKVDTTTFESYSALTQMIIETKLDKSIFNTYTANTTDDVVTGATLVGATLELERNNGLTDVTVDLSPLSGISENTFISGTTLVGTNYTLERNDGVDITTDFNPIVSGKVDTTLFDSYTANTVDNNTFITGTTLVGTNYTINENNGTSFTTDFNPIVSGFTTGSTLQEVLENGSIADLKTANIDFGSSVSNPAANGFSRLELQQNGFIQLSSENPAGDFGFIRINGQTGEAQLNQGGLKYGTDYSATFTDRSLVDKEYVDDNISDKLDTTIFDTYTANTTDNVVTGATLNGSILELERNNGLTDVTVDLISLSGISENTFVSGATLVGTTLDLERNDGVTVSVNLSSLTGDSDTNTFITGTTLTGNDLIIERNDGIGITTDLTPVLSGKVNTTLFDTYTANTTDNVVTGATLNGTILELERNNGLTDVTVDLSSLTGAVDTNTFVTAATLTNTTLDITRNDGVNIPVNLGSLTFTGNTSGTCINELWVSNISGCSSVTIGTELVVNDDTSINGHLTVTSSGSNTSDTVFLVQDSLGNHIIEGLDSGQVHVGDLVNSASPSSPTLMIGAGKTPNDRGSLAFTSTGIGIGGDNDATGDYLFFQLPGNDDSRWRLESAAQFGFTLVSRQNNNFGSGSGLRSSFYTSRTYGVDFLLGYNSGLAVTDTVGYRFNTKDNTIAGANDVERFVIENGASETKSYFDNISVLGVGTSNPDTNVRLHISGDTLITGGLSADTITLSDTPTLNNSGTEVLVRNSTTGEIEYRASSTFSGSSSGDINTGNVLWVDSIFGDDATAVTNRQDLPYLTIESALDYATTGDTVIVRPGEYPEELNIPEGVSLVSEGGWEVTILGPSPASAAGAIVELNEDSFIDGFSINVPQGSFDGIISTHISGTSTANNITFYGNGGVGSTGTGLYKTGGGKLIGTGIRVEGGGMSNCLKVDSGTLALEGVHVPQSNGDIDNVLLVTTSSGTNAGRAQMVGFNCGNNNVTNAIRTEGGSSGVIPVAKIFTPNITNSTNALSASGDYENINLLGGALEDVTYAVKIDLTGTGVDASYRITSNHQPNYIYTPAVAYTAEFGLDFTQESTDEFKSSKNLFGLSQMSLGFAEKGTELNAGRGAPSTVGMKVFTTDNTATSASDGGNITDVTDDAKSKEGSTITFQSGGTNTTILFTTQRISSDLTTPLKYYGIDLNVLQKKVGGEYVFEYWNGTEWVEDLVHIHSADLGYSYGNELFLRSQSDENLVFDLGKESWSAKTINGVNGYWMRCRTVSTGTTKPTIEQSKIIYDSSTISKDGVLSFNGKSLYKEVSNLYCGTWGYPGVTLSDYNVTVGSGVGLQTWTHEFLDSQLTNGEAATFVLKIPQGTSTSQKVNVNATYTLDGSAADTTAAQLAFSFLPVEVANIRIADGEGGKEPVPRTVSATTAFNVDAAQTTTPITEIGEDKMFQSPLGSFDISDYYEGDIVLMRLEKDSGTNVNFNLVSLDFEVSKWSLGKQSEGLKIATETIFSENWDDFGVANGWQYVQDTSNPNLWVVSSGTSRSGDNSAYITDESGSTNVYAYDVDETQNGAHLYVDFSIPSKATSLTINFYWTAKGENGGGSTSWDYGRVGLLPTSVTPTQNTEFSSTYRIGADSNLNKFNVGYNGGAFEDDWQLETIPVSNSLWTAGEDRRLCLTWKSDFATGVQPPFAVADISIDIQYIE